MQSFLDDSELRAYFTDPDRRIRLRKGEVLIRQDEENDRLFLVLEGTLSARVRSPGKGDYELFQTTQGRFVGVYSFFSETYRSLMTLVAEEDCELAYVDARQFHAQEKHPDCVFERFMPVIGTELVHRYKQTQELTLERERTFEKLLQSEKMASLGQMAAGIAHELNNAIVVLQRNSEWLCRNLSEWMAKDPPDHVAFYEMGLARGQQLSSREVRQRSRSLGKTHNLSHKTARKTAETGLSDAELEAIRDPEAEVPLKHHYWKIGMAFHDLLVAARQATQVVQSVRSLGAPRPDLQPDLDVNESIREALTLLKSPLRKVNVELSLGPLPLLPASKSELVQVWTNLIRNAYESMHQAEIEHPTLQMTSERSGNGVVVRVQDNGPGIPEGIVPTIFQPNVTTKVGGLSFGLGLGLTVVQRVVQTCGGRIGVKSRPGETVFEVFLPIGAVHGRA